VQLLKEQEQAKIDAESARDTEMKQLEAPNRQQSLGFRSTVSTGIDRQTSLFYLF